MQRYHWACDCPVSERAGCVRSLVSSRLLTCSDLANNRVSSRFPRGVEKLLKLQALYAALLPGCLLLCWLDTRVHLEGRSVTTK